MIDYITILNLVKNFKPGCAPAYGRCMPGFLLSLSSVSVCICVCVCMCVCPRGHKLLVAGFRLYMIGRIMAAAFQFHFMALAIDVVDRHDPSNEMRRQFQPKKT